MLLNYQHENYINTNMGISLKICTKGMYYIRFSVTYIPSDVYNDVIYITLLIIPTWDSVLYYNVFTKPNMDIIMM